MSTPRRALFLVWAVHLVAAAVLVSTVAVYLDRPPRGDEADFAWFAREAIAVHGAPWVAAADTAKRLPDGARETRFYGLWHPPLYLYVLGAVASVAPASIAALRAVGLLALALSGVVMWRMSTDALGRETPAAVRAWPLSIAILSPLVTQGSLYLDIDNTLLATGLLLFVWRFARPGDRLAPSRLLELVALLGLVACTKLTDMPMLVMACAIYAMFEPRPLRQLAALGLVVGLTAGLAVAAYVWYCRVTGIPPEYMFTVGFGGRRDLFATTKSLLAVVRAVRWHVTWFSPVLTLALAAVALERVAVWWRTRRAEPLDLALILSCGLFVAYGIFGAMFGKYTVPAALMAALTIGVRTARSWRTWPAPSAATAGAAALALGAALALWPVALARTREFRSLEGVIADPRNGALVMLAGGAGLLGGLALRRAGRGGDRLAAVTLACVMTAAVAAPVDAARLLCADADNGPLRAGPERGVMDIAAWLAASTPAGAAIIAPKDIGYLSGRPYYSSEEWLVAHPDRTTALPLPSDVGVLVDSVTYPVWPPDLVAALPVVRTETLGTYRAYVVSPEARR